MAMRALDAILNLPAERAAELSHAEFRVLVYLADAHNRFNGGVRGAYHVATRCGMSRPGVAAVFDGLESKGFVRRYRETVDGAARVGLWLWIDEQFAEPAGAAE